MPPILPFNLLHILTIISVFSLIKNSKNPYLKEIFRIIARYIVIPLSLAILYLIIIIWANQTDIFKIYTYLLLAIEVPLCVIYLCWLFEKHSYTSYEVLNILLVVGFIQGIIAILCLFIPTFKDIIVNTMIINSKVDKSIFDSLFEMADYRLNGLAANLTFTTPVLQMVLCIISIHLALTKTNKYIIFMPILLISAIINARSSFIILIYGFILVLLVNSKAKQITKVLVILLMSIPLYQYISEMIMGKSEFLMKWLGSGLDEIVAFFQGERIGYFAVATTDYIRFPKGWEIVWGTGKDIVGLVRGKGSDIGYINDLWLGGIVFCGIIYLTIINFYMRGIHKDDKSHKLIVYLFIITLLIINIKGSIVSDNEFINASLLLTSHFIIKNKFIRQEYG
jgi:hypothetical protein